MLKWIRDTLRKSRAAVAVQNTFERMPMPFIIPGGPAKFANALVGLAWDDNPSAFDGQHEPSPHHMTVAAIALATGAEVYKENPVVSAICKGALGIILDELIANRFKYSFNETDLSFLDIAERVLFADELAMLNEV